MRWIETVAYALVALRREKSPFVYVFNFAAQKRLFIVFFFQSNMYLKIMSIILFLFYLESPRNRE